MRSVVTLALLALLAACGVPRALAPTPPAPAPAVAPTPAPAEVAAPPALGAGLTRRPSLDEVAAAVARAASDQQLVPAAAVRAAMAAVLGSGRWPHVLAGRGTDAEIAAQLRHALDELRATVTLDAIGVATADGRAGRVGVVVALPAPSLPIETTRAGATTRLTMAWPWAVAPAVFAVTPMSARRLTPQVAAGQLVVQVDCARRDAAPDAAPDEAIEISAGTDVVAVVVAPCGPASAPAAAAPAADAIEVGPPATSRVEIEQRLFELVNRERTAHGRAALRWDAAAHAFARAHAADMAQFGYVAHHAPDGAALVVRIERAALSAWTTRENVGHADGPGEVHLAFMRSPGHRANLLADDIDRGAIGVVLDPRAAGAFYVTEFFLTPRP